MDVFAAGLVYLLELLEVGLIRQILPTVTVSFSVHPDHRSDSR